MMHFTPKLAVILWGIGTAINLLATLFVLNMWIHNPHLKIEHLNPAWFIPVVANIVVPLGGAQFGYQEISWFYFSFGLLFWIILLILNFYRLIFHSPLPEALMPTFVILMAPPSIGFLAYYNLTAQLDTFARILYYISLFFALLIATQLPRFLKLKFTLTWWAYSFPLSAITVSTMTMYQTLGGTLFKSLSLVLLTILTIVLTILVTKTGIALVQGKICVKDD